MCTFSCNNFHGLLSLLSVTYMNVAQSWCVLTAAQQAVNEREAERRVLLEEDEQQYHTPNESVYSQHHLHHHNVITVIV